MFGNYVAGTFLLIIAALLSFARITRAGAALDEEIKATI